MIPATMRALLHYAALRLFAPFLLKACVCRGWLASEAMLETVQCTKRADVVVGTILEFTRLTRSGPGAAFKSIGRSGPTTMNITSGRCEPMQTP